MRGYQGGECNFYCSSQCQNLCQVFRSHGVIQNKNRRDIVYAKEAREILIEDANNQCEICGSDENLEIHHIKPFKTDPLEAYDLDNLVVLCHQCHKDKGHSSSGCKTSDLRKCK